MTAAPALFGQEGELISLSISVDPKLLEELLEAVAQLSFPVNPQLYHRTGQVIVEFPAYSARIEEVRETLRAFGFDADALVSSPVVQAFLPVSH